MVRKMLILLAALLLLTSPALAASRVVDDANLFTRADIARVESAILAFIDKTGMDFAVWTSDNARDEEDMLRDADDFYDNGGYGLDGEHSGAVFFLDMYNRIPNLSTCGAMIDYVTDERLEALWSDALYDLLAEERYADAAILVISDVQTYWERGIPEGQYRYDVITGQRTTARHKALTAGEIGVSAILALIVACVIGVSVKRSYSLKGSTYHYDMLKNSALELTASEDTYLRSTTRVIPKAQSSGSGGGGGHSGGSGTRSSSSGRSHGGGSGRKF